MKDERNINVNKLKKQLMDLIIKTVISGESHISDMCSSYLSSSYNAYEVLGFDIMFDEFLKPWLLEVNFFIKTFELYIIWFLKY